MEWDTVPELRTSDKDCLDVVRQVEELCLKIRGGTSQGLEFLHRKVEVIGRPPRVMVIGKSLTRVVRVDLLQRMVDLPNRELPIPNTEIRWFRYGAYNSQQMPKDRNYRDCVMKFEKLQRIEVIDGEDIDGMGNGEANKQIFLDSDLIIAVFDESEIWDKKYWEYLSENHDVMMGHLILAIVMNPEALQSEVEDKIRIMRENITRIMKGIVEVKPLKLRNGELHGYEELGKGIKFLVRRGIDADKRLLRVYHACTEELREVANILRDRKFNITQNREVLERIDFEINEIKQKQVEDIQNQAKCFGEIGKRLLPKIQTSLAKIVGFLPTVHRYYRLVKVSGLVRKRTLRELILECQQRLKFDRTEQIEIFAQHWKGASGRIRENVGLELGEFPREIIEADSQKYESELLNEIEQSWEKSHLTRWIHSKVLNLQPKLGQQLIGAIGLLMLAGIFGSIGFDQIAWFLLVAVILFAGISAWWLRSSVREISQKMEEEFGQMHIVIGAELKGNLAIYRLQICELYQRKFYPVFRIFDEETRNYEPLNMGVKQLELSIASRVHSLNERVR